MSRSDLLVSLVKASTTGDRQTIRQVAEALIADERAKQHNVLADRLAKALYSASANGSSNGRGAIEPYSAKGREYVEEHIPRRRLDELVLPAKSLEAVSQLIHEQMRSDVLRSHALQPRHKLLFVGPPGNGKTTLAEAIAEALAVPFFVVRYDAIIGSFLGETATRLRRVFDYARTTPCVLFFDEFDAVGKERGDTHETGEIKRVVTSLLMQIDDLPSYTTVIAATNHEELLDRAAWRRFELKIHLPMPSEAELADFITRFFESHTGALGATPKNIAKRLGKISFAEAEQFSLNIRRRQVLSLGDLSLADALKAALIEWESIRGQAKTPRSVKGGKTVPADTDA